MGWLIWLGIGLVALIIEAFTADFTFLMFTGGALVGAAVSWGSGNEYAAIVAFALSTCLLLLVARPWIKKKFNSRGKEAGVYAHMGKPAQALTLVTSTDGRIRLGSEEWSARTRGSDLPAGSQVVVVAIEGATAIVEAAPSRGGAQSAASA